MEHGEPQERAGCARRATKGFALVLMVAQLAGELSIASARVLVG